MANVISSQCDFPIVYASGFQGIAGYEPNALAKDLAPLFDCIARQVTSGPSAAPGSQLRRPMDFVAEALML